MSRDPSDIAASNKAFEALRQKNPDLTFGEFFWFREVDEVVDGRDHATLGPKLTKYEDWWAPGRKVWRRYTAMSQIEQHHRVIDYGCGSLRVGAHFISEHEPGCYFGLDIRQELLDLGRKQIGDLELNKKPKLAVISPNSLEEAFAFEADRLISTAVAYHIHPDEMSGFFQNFVKILSKPESELIFDARISKNPVQYSDCSWSWPLERFHELLTPLEYVGFSRSTERIHSGETVEFGRLHYRRPS